MLSRAEIKARARAQLGSGIFTNNWMLALLVCLIIYAVTAAVSALLSSVAPIIVVLLSGPLNYALAKMFLKQASDGQPMELKDILSGFTDDLGGSLILGLLIDIFTALWSLLFVIPGIIKSCSYAMAYFIRVENPGLDSQTCITESRTIMRGHKWQLFVLDLSFLGWYIVGALCLGIGTLWVIPYHQAARAQFYAALRNTGSAC